MVKSYVLKIQDLEGELLHLKTSNATNSSHFVDCADSDDDGYGSKHDSFARGIVFSSDCDVKGVDISDSALGICLFVVLRRSACVSGSNLR